MDYALMASSATEMITSMGMPVAFTRLDVSVVKTFGVFTKSEETDDTGSPISMTNTTQKELMIPGNIKTKPKVGDDMSCKLGSYHVIKVDEMNPAGIPVVYKVTVT